MHYRLRTTAVLLGALLAAAPVIRAAAPAAAPNPADDPKTPPRAVIESICQQVIQILRDKSNTIDQRRAKVEAVALPHMDFEVLSRLTLGRFWRTMTDAQRKDFVEQYKQHLVATYGHISDDYSDEDVQVANDRTESDGDVVVYTRILGSKNGGPKQEIAKVEYRLRKSNRGAGPWKIIDVTIDGISLVTNFRSQFSEIINNGGVDKLIQLLREKNASGQHELPNKK